VEVKASEGGAHQRQYGRDRHRRTQGLGLRRIFVDQSKPLTRQQNALNSSKQPGNAIWALMQWNNDAVTPADVEGQDRGATISGYILWSLAGWLRDGNVKRHDSTSVKTKPRFRDKVFSRILLR